MTRSRTWAAAVVLAAAASALAGDTPPPRAERGPDFVRRVHEAIQRGVAWLRTKQCADGSFHESAAEPWHDWSWGRGWGGWGSGWGSWGLHPSQGNAMAVFVTLRACRVPNEDPCVRLAWDALHRAAKNFEDVRKEPKRRLELFGTGGMSMALLAIASHGERVEPADDQSVVHLSAEDAAWAGVLVDLLVSRQHENGGWLPEGAEEGRTVVDLRAPDIHPCTYSTLLGLDAAARCGIAIDPAVWKRALDHLVAAQESFGPSVRREAVGDAADARSAKPSPVDRARGWGWGHGNPDATRPHVATTGEGVASVAICRRRLAGRAEMTKKLDADSERSLWDGLAWIGRNWPTDLPNDLPPRDRARTLLYGGFPALAGYEGVVAPCCDVARAGALAGVDRMADLDWYAYGAEPLLAMQSKAGCWGYFNGEPSEDELKSTHHPELVARTCQALLFLATRAPRTSRAVTPGNEVNFAGAATLSGPDLNAFLGVVIARLRQADDLDAFERLLDGATSIGPKIVEPLLLRLEAADAGDRAAANDVLVHATGNDTGFDPDADAAARGDAVTKWEAWWMSVKDRLVYDAATKRLVAK